MTNFNNDSGSDSTVHSEISLTETILKIDAPVNQFKNQSVICPSEFSNKNNKDYISTLY